MALFFSASTRGFFDDRIHTAMPDDVVAITTEEHAQLLAAQADGKTIGADEAGRPIASATPVDLTTLRTRAIGAVKIEAHRRILAVAPLWRQLNDARELPLATDAAKAPIEARFAAIDAIRAASNALETVVNASSAAQLTTIDATDDCHWPQGEPA